MSVRSFVFQAARYGYENSYGGGGVANKTFGFNVALGELRYRRGEVELGKLGDVFYDKFVARRHEYSFGVDFVVSNPWWLLGAFGEVATTGSGPYTHTFTVSKAIKSMVVEAFFEAAGANVRRVLKGVVVSGFTMNFDVDRQTINTSLDMEGGIIETNDSTSFSMPNDDINYPYTFVDSKVKVDGAEVGFIRSSDLRVETGAALFRQLGNSNTVAAVREGVMRISGSMSVAMMDRSWLDKVKNFTEHNMTIILSNGGSGVNERSITFNLGGVVFNEHGQPYRVGEMVIERVSFRAKTINAVAVNNTATMP